MQKGFQNEINFKEILDNKFVEDIPKNMQYLIFTIFSNVNYDSKIQCWLSKYFEKADIKIRINGIIKGISIKSGNNCSMHQENMKRFSEFLLKIGIEEPIKKYFEKYIEGNIGGKRVSAKEYVVNKPNEIKSIKETFNSYYNKINLIMRFVFQGTEVQKFGCDALIYGTPANFLWATKDEITKYLLNYEKKQNSCLSIGALSIKCYDRNLRNNPKRVKGQSDIQVKWYRINEDLLYITKIREAESVLNNK